MIYRARITRLAVEGIYVEIPRLLRGQHFGPIQTLEGQPHATTTPQPYIEGDHVLVALVEDSPDDPVLLGRLRGS